MRLRVCLDAPSNGWIGLRIEAETATIEQAVSYTPNDSISDLVSALLLIAKGMDQATVDLHLEPVIWTLRFARQQDSIVLRVIEHPRYPQRSDDGTLILEATGSFREVCHPFWKALRDLESSIDAARWAEQWRHPFPSEAMKRLTDVRNNT